MKSNKITNLLIDTLIVLQKWSHYYRQYGTKNDRPINEQTSDLRLYFFFFRLLNNYLFAAVSLSHWLCNMYDNNNNNNNNNNNTALLFLIGTRENGGETF